MDLLWITNDAELALICQQWQQCDVLAVDTEFVRTRSFYPQLGLIQVYAGQQVVLLDALAIQNWQPLTAILTNPQISKVFHACSEDVEIFYHLTGQSVVGLIDTQVVAAFVGLGSSLGFANLLEQQLGKSVDKGESRSDWLKRPLTESQIHYAADDVFWLLPLYQKLVAEYGHQNQWLWALADSQALAAPERFAIQDDKAYLKVKLAWQLQPAQLMILQTLAAWRETEARQRDLARNFIVNEAALVALSRRAPNQLHELARIPELSPVEIRRYGGELLSLIAKAKQQPEQSWPAAIERLIDWPGYRQLYQQCQHCIADIAQQQGINPELLASRKLIDRFIRRCFRQLPSPLTGWRHQLLDQKLRQLCSAP